MSYSVESIAPFRWELKHLLKKYPSLRQEIDSLLNSLEVTPTQGTSLGYGYYKIRLRIVSKGKGKGYHLRFCPYQRSLFALHL